ncbi:MAG: topoisomerase DNA-binding C4 zinc finger domain-containing protein, partial [Pseudomonadota bacterium]|nr:topoisomerase DNA-binding C4 zinc finger domain-containing protein [Pseudomonadota bacterium]
MSQDEGNDKPTHVSSAWEQEFLSQDSTGYIGAPSKRYRCPKCQHPLVLKKGKNGSFWGCEDFPRCDYTANDEEGRPVRAKKFFC